MSQTLKRDLREVRARLRRARLLDGAGWGLAAGAAVGVVLGLLRWTAQVELGRGPVLALLAVGALGGVLMGLRRAPGWAKAARAVDRAFSLKDRTLSALQLEGPADDTSEAGSVGRALRQLQAEDAHRHLQQLRPEVAAPVAVPRILAPAVGTALLALFLAGWPPRASQARAEPAGADPAVLAQLAPVLEVAEELQRRAEQEEDEAQREAMEALANEMRETAEALDAPGVELRQALVELSQMQEDLAALRAQFAEGLVDSHLESLGEAMQGSEALRAAGAALEAGDLEAAAEALERAESQLGQESPSSREAGAQKATAKDLQQVAEQMAQDQLESLSQATQQMADGMRDQDSEQAREGAAKVGEQVKKQGRAKGTARSLAAMGQKLGEAKNAMAKAAGKKPSQQNSLAQGQSESKSDKPSLNFGMKTHGGVDGARTEIDSRREFEQLSGMLGAGDSEFETTQGEQKEERSRRSVQEIHEDYRKMSEAVLEAEHLPLGYRQSIRRYFEAIRPTAADLESMEQGEPPGEGSSAGEDGGN